MSSVSEKLTYLNSTKTALKDMINLTGAGITSETTFRNYAAKLYDGYVEILKDKYTLLDAMPKGTGTGVNVSVQDAVDLPVYNLEMDKESTQDGTPTPDNPVEVKTVKGYRNLFDYNNLKNNIQTFIISGNERNFTINGYGTYVYSINLTGQKKITGSWSSTKLNGDVSIVYEDDSTDNFISLYTSGSGNGTINLTTNSSKNIKGIRFRTFENSNITINDLLITNETISLPYVPYGNNYVNVAVSDGTNTNNYSIPLNNNEIVGIGDYKDELLVDKSGHVFINKKTGKVVLDGTENWIISTSFSNQTYSVFVTNDFNNSFANNKTIFSNYFVNNNRIGTETTTQEGIGYYSDVYGLRASILKATVDTIVNDFKTWLGTHNTDVYYILATPQVIDLNTTIDVTLFKGTNNISNSEDANMQIRYVKNVEASLGG